MNKISNIFIAVFLSLFISSTASAAASACTDVTKEIADYTKNLPGSAQKSIFPLPWQDITWLQSRLGPGVTNAFVETVATWNRYHYTLIAQGGQVVDVEGSKPELLANYGDKPSVSDATSALGMPDNIDTNNLVDYTWTCETGSILTMTSNEDNSQKIISYKGTYCPEGATKDHCVTFADPKPNFPNYNSIGSGLQKASLYIQHPPLQPQHSATQAQDIADKQTLEMAKDTLHINLKNFAEMQGAAVATLGTFYENLRTCKPGTYNYALPFLLGGLLLSNEEPAPYFYFVTAKIQGITANKCIVVSQAKIGPNNGSATCEYPVATLPSFTQSQAMGDANFQNNLTASQSVSMLWKSCQIYLNGSLVNS